MLKIIVAIIICSGLSVAFVACQSKQVPPVSSNQSSVAQKSVEEKEIISPIALVDYSVHKVQTGKVYKVREEGTVKTYKTAWLVKLTLDNMPKSTSSITRFYLGDYKVPEYGGWLEGIYFRIYEAQLLEQLIGKEFKCSYLEEETTLKKVLTLPNGINLPLENEAVVLGRQRR